MQVADVLRAQIRHFIVTPIAYYVPVTLLHGRLTVYVSVLAVQWIACFFWMDGLTCR